MIVKVLTLQPNPLDQLQQQTEMWSNYPDGIRPRSSGTKVVIVCFPFFCETFVDIALKVATLL